MKRKSEMKDIRCGSEILQNQKNVSKTSKPYHSMSGIKISKSAIKKTVHQTSNISHQFTISTGIFS